MLKLFDLDKAIEDLRDKKVVLWSVNEFGKEILAFLRKYNIRVLAFCDNDENQWNSEVEGLIIISPQRLEQLFKDNQDIIVIINNVTASSYNAIINQLESIGINKYIIAKTSFINFYINGPKIVDEIYDNLEISDAINELKREQGQLQVKLKFLEVIRDNSKNLLLVCLPTKTGDVTLNVILGKSKVNFINMWHSSQHFSLVDLSPTFMNFPVRIITATRELWKKDT